MREVERRSVVQKIELRDGAAGTPGTMTGVAAVFGSLSEDLGGFVEELDPHCFDEVLRSNPDVIARAEHTSTMLLGRTASGTLRLFTAEDGLHFECDLPDTTVGRDVRELCRRGDYRGASFAFTVDKEDQKWTIRDGMAHRLILRVRDLVDVSCVATPAYLQTSVSARALEQAKEVARQEGHRTGEIMDFGGKTYALQAKGTVVGAVDVSARAAGGSADLPLAAREKAWDANAAADHVRNWASQDHSGDKSEVDWAKYGKAFFWHAENPSGFGDFKLGFADVEGGTLKAVPRGIFAVAAVLQGSRGGVDIPEADQTAIKAKVAAYYKRMAAQFEDSSIVAPWEAKAAPETEEKRDMAKAERRAALLAKPAEERMLMQGSGYGCPCCQAGACACCEDVFYGGCACCAAGTCPCCVGESPCATAATCAGEAAEAAASGQAAAATGAVSASSAPDASAHRSEDEDLRLRLGLG